MCSKCPVARCQTELLAVASTASPTASPKSSSKRASLRHPESGQRLAGYVGDPEVIQDWPSKLTQCQTDTSLASPGRMGDNASAFCFPEEETLSRAPGTYAVFETSQGTIVCRLLEKE